MRRHHARHASKIPILHLVHSSPPLSPTSAFEQSNCESAFQNNHLQAIALLELHVFCTQSTSLTLSVSAKSTSTRAASSTTSLCTFLSTNPSRFSILRFAIRFSSLSDASSTAFPPRSPSIRSLNAANPISFAARVSRLRSPPNSRRSRSTAGSSRRI